MASVRIEQRAAHLAGPARLDFVNGREGPVARATLTAISNTRRGRSGEGDSREEEATAIQWTLWGKQAENAAQYLGRGSHVNIVGRVRNNNYEKDGQTVYGMAFTAEEIDYLDSRADAQARRKGGQGVRPPARRVPPSAPPPRPAAGPAPRASRPTPSPEPVPGGLSRAQPPAARALRPPFHDRRNQS